MTTISFALTTIPLRAAVLHHAADIVKLLGIHNELWIVTHREPDFDALCAVFLVKSLLGGTTGDTQEQPPSRLDPAALSWFGLGGDVSGSDIAAVGKINWFDPDARASDPGGWAVLLAAYASCVDGGKRLHADRRRRLHSVLYAGMVRRRFLSQDGMERLFSEARRAMISKQLNPIYDALFAIPKVTRTPRLTKAKAMIRAGYSFQSDQL